MDLLANPILLLLIEAFFSFTTILVLLAFFGLTGLFAYIPIAIIAANVQLLKIVDFQLLSSPVALGTVIFSSTYLCTDIITEHFGERKARTSIYLGFIIFVFWTVMLYVTRLYSPSQLSVIQSQAIDILFKPTPMLLIAGMFSFFVSQFYDIKIFQLIRRLTLGKHLWLRNFVSTAISSLVDSTLFSFLAFYILADEKLALSVIVYSYILGTFVLRVFLAIFDTPFIYLSRYALNLHQRYFAHDKSLPQL